MAQMVRLLAAASECHLRSRLPAGPQLGHQLALQAVAMASSTRQSPALARRQLARALAAAGQVAAAEAAYLEAAAAGDAVAGLELARLLAGAGREGEAVQALQVGSAAAGCWGRRCQLPVPGRLAACEPPGLCR
jgi:hypothetical protein